METKIVLPLESLNSSYFNKLVVLQGIVIEISFEYKDPNLGYIQIISLQSIAMTNEKNKFINYINVILQDDYINSVNLGDMVEVLGRLEILVAHKNLLNKFSIVSSNVKILDRLNSLNSTEQEVKNFKDLAKIHMFPQKLAKCIFTDVMIEENIKLLGTLLLFGNSSLNLTANGISDNISLLLVGGSGTYKTTYLNTFKELFPNSVFYYNLHSDIRFTTHNSRYNIGGKPSKKAGLADLANKGMVLIDNLEELTPYKISAFDKNFEYLSRKTTIITAVHTEEDRFDANRTLSNNLKLSRKNSFLKKFSLVLITANTPHQEIDEFEATMGTKTLKSEENSLISKDLLRKYITYAKKNCRPKLKKEAKDYIRTFQKEVLNLNENKSNKIIPIEVVRILTILSESYARITLKQEISVEDVQEVIKIYRQSLINLDLI